MFKLADSAHASQFTPGDATIGAGMLQIGDQFDHFTVQAHLARAAWPISIGPSIC